MSAAGYYTLKLHPFIFSSKFHSRIESRRYHHYARRERNGGLAFDTQIRVRALRRDRVCRGLARLREDAAAVRDHGGGDDDDDDDDDDYPERAKCSGGERKEWRDLESVLRPGGERGAAQSKASQSAAGCRERKFSST